jgi:processive 1,2-diacylglycerol beta-glucosyltransferase
MKKILITSVSAGAGHVRAAAAVEQYLNNTKDYIIENYDLMQFSRSWFKTIYATHYLGLINHFQTDQH